MYTHNQLTNQIATNANIVTLPPSHTAITQDNSQLANNNNNNNQITQITTNYANDITPPNYANAITPPNYANAITPPNYVNTTAPNNYANAIPPSDYANAITPPTCNYANATTPTSHAITPLRRPQQPRINPHPQFGGKCPRQRRPASTTQDQECANCIILKNKIEHLEQQLTLYQAEQGN